MNGVTTALARLHALGEAELDEVCRRHGVRVLTLFGSAADRDADEPGDLDLGVVFQPDADHDLLGLLDSLVRVLGTEQIDLLGAQRASETARRRAIADGIGLYESEPMALAFAAMAADALFMRTNQMRRAALGSLSP